jgi:hypothetical protein
MIGTIGEDCVSKTDQALHAYLLKRYYVALTGKDIV